MMRMFVMAVVLFSLIGCEGSQFQKDAQASFDKEMLDAYNQGLEAGKLNLNPILNSYIDSQKINSVSFKESWNSGYIAGQRARQTKGEKQ